MIKISKRLIQTQRCFTLIEILVVLAIIALLASVVTTRVTGYLAEAKIKTAKSQIKVFEQALELYMADHDYYPTTEQGLESLIQKPSVGNIPENYPPEGYLKKQRIPMDPWGKPYIYLCEDGEHFTIISYGADKKEGGGGKGADISSGDI